MNSEKASDEESDAEQGDDDQFGRITHVVGRVAIVRVTKAGVLSAGIHLHPRWCIGTPAAKCFVRYTSWM